MKLQRYIKVQALYQVMFLILGMGFLQAQGPISLTNEQAASWSGVNKFMNESPNADSAVVYLQKFSKIVDDATYDLLSFQLHNYFADLLVTAYRGDSISSPERWKKAGFARDMVNLLAQEKTGPLHQATNGLVTWAKLAVG